MNTVTNIKTRKPYVESPRQQYVREAQSRKEKAETELLINLQRAVRAKKALNGSVTAIFWCVFLLGALFLITK
jgi:hypothetical protein